MSMPRKVLLALLAALPAALAVRFSTVRDPALAIAVFVFCTVSSLRTPQRNWITDCAVNMIFPALLIVGQFFIR